MIMIRRNKPTSKQKVSFIQCANLLKKKSVTKKMYPLDSTVPPCQADFCFCSCDHQHGVSSQLTSWQEFNMNGYYCIFEYGLMKLLPNVVLLADSLAIKWEWAIQIFKYKKKYINSYVLSSVGLAWSAKTLPLVSLVRKGTLMSVRQPTKCVLFRSHSYQTAQLLSKIGFQSAFKL